MNDAMDAQKREIMRSIRDGFLVESIYVFGSCGRGDAGIESNVDIPVISNEGFIDAFELAFEIRRFLHSKLDRALDVIVTSKEQFNKRRDQSWTESRSHTLRVSPFDHIRCSARINRIRRARQRCSEDIAQLSSCAI